MKFDNITDVPGIKVGHCEDPIALTGCSVLLTEDGAICGVDVRGSAPGTRETDALDPINAVQQVHAICLTGGSAYGLEAASGVMKYLEEKNIGLDVGVAKVPIVPSAVIFDLVVGNPSIRPDMKMGYEAASRAKKGKFPQGNVGVGCGAMVGKIPGLEFGMKGGLGSSSIEGVEDLVVGAIVAVNASGDVRDPKTNTILAGARNPETGEMIDCLEFIKTNQSSVATIGTNTTIGAVGVNAKLTKAEAKKIAGLVQNALARTIYPVHTMFDGDTIFVLGTGTKTYPVDYLGTLAAEAMEKAVIRAVTHAEKVGSIESYSSIRIQ